MGCVADINDYVCLFYPEGWDDPLLEKNMVRCSSQVLSSDDCLAGSFVSRLCLKTLRKIKQVLKVVLLYNSIFYMYSVYFGMSQ